MSDRRPSFTDRATKALALATAAAEQFGHASVTPIHIAVGIVREGSGVASTAMRFHGIAPKDVEPSLMRALATLPASDRLTAPPLLNPDAERLIEDARSEAGELSHSYLGTEHMLLALLRNPVGVVAEVFGLRGLNYRDARARIEWIVGTDPLNPAPFVPPRDAAPGAP